MIRSRRKHKVPHFRMLSSTKNHIYAAGSCCSCCLLLLLLLLLFLLLVHLLLHLFLISVVTAADELILKVFAFFLLLFFCASDLVWFNQNQCGRRGAICTTDPFALLILFYPPTAPTPAVPFQHLIIIFSSFSTNIFFG